MLFDNEASHSFVSIDCVVKHDLLQLLVRTEMIIIFRKGEIKVRHVCPKLNLSISEVDFTADHIFLE